MANSRCVSREHPAEEVFVTGTFDNWTKSVRLEKVGDVFEKEVEFGPDTEKIFYKVGRATVLIARSDTRHFVWPPRLMGRLMVINVRLMWVNHPSHPGPSRDHQASWRRSSSTIVTHLDLSRCSHAVDDPAAGASRRRIGLLRGDSGGARPAQLQAPSSSTNSPMHRCELLPEIICPTRRSTGSHAGVRMGRFGLQNETQKDDVSHAPMIPVPGYRQTHDAITIGAS
jgi:hypothetical protein